MTITVFKFLFCYRSSGDVTFVTGLKIKIHNERPDRYANRKKTISSLPNVLKHVLKKVNRILEISTVKLPMNCKISQN